MHWQKYALNQHIMPGVLHISIKHVDNSNFVYVKGWKWSKATALEEKWADLYNGSIRYAEVRCLVSIIKSFHSVLFIKSLMVEFSLWLRHEVSLCPFNIEGVIQLKENELDILKICILNQNEDAISTDKIQKNIVCSSG